MEDEHDRLREMISAVSFAILNARNRAPRLDALRLLRQRFALHCRLEESIAQRAGEAWLDMLCDDHRDLLGMLDRCRPSLMDGDDALTRSLLEDFADALAHHDQAVDMPVFRLISGTQANSSL
ncbi:MAG TPA: hypothetical protein HPQ04_07855 [Rhodospirillaceae bacterium]|nr:hypothetical protein [Rhodospirillaceae bacterium]